MPTFPSSCSPVCFPFTSGLLGMLFLSIDDQLPGVLVERGGLAVLMLPLASFSVVMPPPVAASSLALFNIAAASTLEKLGGRMGLCRGECEKNSGESGCARFFEEPEGKVCGSIVCRGLNLGRDLFSGGSEPNTALPDPLSSVLECFEACVSFGVDGRVRFCGLRDFLNGGGGKWSLVECANPCSCTLRLKDGLLVFLIMALSACAVDSPSCRLFATTSLSLSLLGDGGTLTLVEDALGVSAVCSWSTNRLLNSFCEVETDLASCVMERKLRR